MQEEPPVAVRVTALSGGSAGEYYTLELGKYYLDAGEPPGLWFGEQAAALELEGELDPSHFLSLMAGRLPISGTVMGRAYGDTSVRGYDVTFNAPKSVSLLWAFGDDHIRSEVLAAHDTAVCEVLGWVEERAHTRVTRDKQTFVVDTQGLAVGRFEQHTSRTGDPHLHTHAVVIAKVLDEAGNWLALDARMLLKDQRTLSALYHASLRTELTGRLGVEWADPENCIAELVGMSGEVLSRFSSRTDQYEQRLQDKLDRFRATLGREPSERERWQLEREAVRDSRPRKDTSVTGDALSAKWRENLRALGVDPDELIRAVIGRHLEARGIGIDEGVDVVMAARIDLVESVSTWRTNDLVREVARRIPTDVTLSARALVEWIDRTASVVTGADIELAPTAPEGTPLRKDGRPITESDLDRRFTTRSILSQEEFVAAWAIERLDDPGRSALLEQGELDRAQHHAASAVAGTKPLVVIVGPAGSGKTASLRAAVDHLHRTGRPLFGVAPSATAAAVLGQQTGAPADTLDKLLHEHTLLRGPDPRYALPAGTTVLVDEAGMIPTAKLARFVHLAEHRQWRVVLIGDPRQLPAVGRGGMFGHLAASDVIELDRVHRFHEPWERDASLGLRHGDPDALDAYQRHERIHDGTAIDMTRVALADWAHHRADGENVIMLAVSNETDAKLNSYAQRDRVMHGEVDATRGARGRDCRVHIGDEIVTRENSRDLRTDRGVMVRNRAHWTVTDITGQGEVHAVGPDGAVTLPPDYMSRSVELGYAQTVHGGQGRTVDHSLLVIDGPIDGRGLYVGLTRGAETNHAYVAVDGNRTGRSVLENAVSSDWADTPAIDIRAQLRLRATLQARIAQTLDQAPTRPAADRLRDLGRTPEPPDRGLGL
jgi:conjugative relaxase-like TrwC/TraI family protein